MKITKKVVLEWMLTILLLAGSGLHIYFWGVEDGREIGYSGGINDGMFLGVAWLSHQVCVLTSPDSDLREELALTPDACADMNTGDMDAYETIEWALPDTYQDRFGVEFTP